MPPGVCAAICTRDRTDALRRALRSLERQLRPPAEILVVDNAPGGGATRELILDEFPFVRYVTEPVPGLDFARNRALRETACEVVAFMDDDVVADPGWVGAFEDVFNGNGRVAICTGKVDALSLETEGERLFEANGGFARGNERILLPRDRGKRFLHGMRAPLIAWSISIGAGCSFAVRRRTALELGGFDEALDLGAQLPGGGETDLLWRALHAGHEVVYEPLAKSRHEHRKDLEASIRQIVDHNRATIAMISKAAVLTHGRERAVVIAFLVWRLAKPGVRLLSRLAGSDPLPAAVLFRIWEGCLRGIGAYPAARRLADRRRAEASRSYGEAAR